MRNKIGAENPQLTDTQQRYQTYWSALLLWDYDGRYPMPKIHYVEIALRVEFKPEMKPRILEVAGKLRQEIETVPCEDDSGKMRRRTDEELADEIDSVSSAMSEILEAGPLLKDLQLEFIGSVANVDMTADNIKDLHALDAPTSRPRATKRGR